MLPSTKMMGADLPDTMLGAYKKISDYTKKYDPSEITRNEAKFTTAYLTLESDLNALEKSVINGIAQARAAIKACHSEKPKLNKQMRDIQVLEKALGKHASEALKALKSGDTTKIGSIAKKAVKDGASYLKQIKSAMDTAKGLSKSYEQARQAIVHTQSSAAMLKASQVKVILLAP